MPASFTDDVDLMVEETKAAGATASRCIVDGGHPDMDRDLDALKRIATESGVHIVGERRLLHAAQLSAGHRDEDRRSDCGRSGA